MGAQCVEGNSDGQNPSEFTNSNVFTQKKIHITLGKYATEFAKVHLLD
jgi:hypothetical protein